MDAKRTEIDELWFGEYVAFGWADLAAYLAKWARFWLYLEENHRLDYEEETP